MKFSSRHFEIGEFELRDVGRGGHDFLRRLAQKKGCAQCDPDDDDYGADDYQTAVVAFFDDRSWLAEKSAHGEIVGC